MVKTTRANAISAEQYLLLFVGEAYLPMFALAQRELLECDGASHILNRNSVGLINGATKASWCLTLFESYKS